MSSNTNLPFLVIKMPDVVGKTKALGKDMKKGMGGSVKAATSGLKSLNPFKK